MTTTLAPTGEHEAAVEPPGSRKVPFVIVAVVVAAITAMVVGYATAHKVRASTDVEAGIQHHRALMSSAAATLNIDLKRALREPVAERPSSTLPWRDGVQLLRGPLDVTLPVPPRMTTWLLRSTPDAVVGRIQVDSDGYQSVLVEKLERGGADVSFCGYDNLPAPWGNGAEPGDCQKFIDEVPATG